MRNDLTSLIGRLANDQPRSMKVGLTPGSDRSSPRRDRHDSITIDLSFIFQNKLSYTIL